jgi:hypothetical protein
MLLVNGHPSAKMSAKGNVTENRGAQAAQQEARARLVLGLALPRCAVGESREKGYSSRLISGRKFALAVLYQQKAPSDKNDWHVVDE